MIRQHERALKYRELPAGPGPRPERSLGFVLVMCVGAHNLLRPPPPPHEKSWIRP